jgi:uncharacterized small protein (DUF1192 family)
LHARTRPCRSPALPAPHAPAPGTRRPSSPRGRPASPRPSRAPAPPRPPLRQVDIRAAKEGLETALHEARERAGAGNTVAELKTMVATLQREVEVLQARLAKQQEAEARAAAARRAVEAAAGAAEEQRQRVGRLQEALR